MKHALYTETLDDVRRDRARWRYGAAGLLVCTALLSVTVALTLHKERTIITPPVVSRTFWVDDVSASKDYLLEMTDFFAQLALNVSPASVDQKKALFLKYTASSAYGALEARLAVAAERIKKFNVSQVFYRAGELAQSSQDPLAVTFQGRLITVVGEHASPAAQKTYRARYLLDGGQLRVVEFTEADAHEPFNAKKDPSNVRMDDAAFGS